MKRIVAKRVVAVVVAFAAFTLAAAGAASAQTSVQTWPSKPVRIVNTFAAGGAADVLARTIADGLSNAFGQQFYVETHPGAAGAIGVNLVVNTPPDGYNFVITNISMLVLSPISNPKLGYDPYRDLTNIAYIGGSPIVLSVNGKSGIKTLDEFTAFGKKSAKPLTYSSSGVGSSGHLFGVVLGQRLGINVEHVPYKGAALGLMDLVGGHIAFSAQTVTSSAGQIRGGALTGVAVTARERMPDFPTVPTFKELGHPDFVSSIWFALSGPAKLPADIVQKVNRTVVSTMARPDVAEKMRQQGMFTEAMSPDELRALIERETMLWKPVIEKAGLIQK